MTGAFGAVRSRPRGELTVRTPNPSPEAPRCASHSSRSSWPWPRRRPIIFAVAAAEHQGSTCNVAGDGREQGGEPVRDVSTDSDEPAAAALEDATSRPRWTPRRVAAATAPTRRAPAWPRSSTARPGPATRSARASTRPCRRRPRPAQRPRLDPSQGRYSPLWDVHPAQGERGRRRRRRERRPDGHGHDRRGLAEHGHLDRPGGGTAGRPPASSSTARSSRSPDRRPVSPGGPSPPCQPSHHSLSSGSPAVRASDRNAVVTGSCQASGAVSTMPGQLGPPPPADLRHQVPPGRGQRDPDRAPVCRAAAADQALAHQPVAHPGRRRGVDPELRRHLDAPCGPRAASTTSARYCGSVTSSRPASDRAATPTITRLADSSASISSSRAVLAAGAGAGRSGMRPSWRTGRPAPANGAPNFGGIAKTNWGMAPGKAGSKLADSANMHCARTRSAFIRKGAATRPGTQSRMPPLGVGGDDRSLFSVRVGRSFDAARKTRSPWRLV